MLKSNQLHVIDGLLNFNGETVKFCDFDNGTDERGAVCVVLSGETEHYHFYVHFPEKSDFWKIDNPDAYDIVKYFSIVKFYEI